MSVFYHYDLRYRKNCRIWALPQRINKFYSKTILSLTQQFFFYWIHVVFSYTSAQIYIKLLPTENISFISILYVWLYIIFMCVYAWKCLIYKKIWINGSFLNMQMTLCTKPLLFFCRYAQFHIFCVEYVLWLFLGK